MEHNETHTFQINVEQLFHIYISALRTGKQEELAVLFSHFPN